MKPPKFHVGQAALCIDSDHEPVGPEGEEVPNPILNKIYSVIDVEWDSELSAWFLCLAELNPGDWYEETGFAPVELLSSEALAELLSETLGPVTA